MTTMSFNQVSYSTYFPVARAPRTSFAARLAALQAKQEHVTTLTEIGGAVARFALAAIPFTALTWMFVTL